MTPPAWALTFAYWLHMLATVTWIGGLAALSLFVLPAARRNLDAISYFNFLDGIQRRLDPLAWLSLSVLIATGLVQMSSSPYYQGFLTVGNTWAGAILLKHLVVLIMVGINAWITWGVIPRLRRAALFISKGRETLGIDRFERQSQRLLRLNLLLSVIVLALTAIARTA